MRSGVALCFVALIGGFIVTVDSKQQDNEEQHRRRTKQQQQRQRQRPDILFLVLDQWRYDWDGLHETTSGGEALPLRMPLMERAASRGTRFTQAYVPTPICAPVRACLAAGKEYDAAGVPRNHALDYPTNQTTFYQLLRDDGGYHVMSVGKDDLYPGDRGHPTYPKVAYNAYMDVGFSSASRSASKDRVFRETEPYYEAYMDFLVNTYPFAESNNMNNEFADFTAFEIYADCYHGLFDDPPLRKCTTETFVDSIYPDVFVRDEALRLLSEQRGQATTKPWFMQVNFPGPHPPIMATADMAQSVMDRTWPPPFDADFTPPERWACPQQQKGASNEQNPKDPITPEDPSLVARSSGPQLGGICNYAAQLELLDSLMTSILSEVEKESDESLENTIVCITGDHGEMLGDHDMGGKKVPWQPSVSVPLVCWGPGIVPNQVVDQPVTTLDLVGTFLDLAGVAPTSEMTTQSLWPILSRTGNNFDGSNNPTLPTREVISSGYDNWRMVVSSSAGVAYKLVCCQGMCPHLPTGTQPPMGDWHLLLFDTHNDPNDMNAIHQTRPDIVNQLLPYLPQGWCGSVNPN